MPGRKPGQSPMKQLNLDDYGLDHFTAERLNPLMGWYKGKKIDERRYRSRFNLRGGYNDKDPYIWTERLADWRRMERIYFRTKQDYNEASKAYWGYLKELWEQTKKIAGKAASKNLQGYILQELPHPSKRKKRLSSYLLDVHRARGGEEGLSTTHRARKEFKGNDASYYWGWLGTDEEERASELHRRNDTCMRRFGLAQMAFNESVRIRLAAWWKHQAEERGDSQWEYYYSHRKVFTAIENDGRTYGWISGMGGQGDLVWSPDEPPTFFK